MICCDADRLDLVRIGITPKTKFIFTESAAKMIEGDDYWKPA